MGGAVIEDDEIMQTYAVESREHLEDIETDLLTMEENGADIDEELVNKVFRAAHSIKGGAGFMGLQNIKELSHKLESVLGMIRARQMVPTSGIVNTLLLGFDALRDLFNAIEQSDSVDISEHLAALTDVTVASLPEEEKGDVSKTVDIKMPDGRVVFTVDKTDLTLARKEGKCIYLVEYDLINDVHRKGKTPLDVLSTMQETGVILECRVDIAAVGTLDSEVSNRFPFLVLFGTIIESDIIGALCELSEDAIHLVSEDAVVDLQSFRQDPPVIEQYFSSYLVDQSPAGEDFEIPKTIDVSQPAPQPAASDAGPANFPRNEDIEIQIHAAYEVRNSASDAEAPATGIQLSARMVQEVRNNAGGPGEAAGKDARKTAAPAETNLRVQISLLDTLMILAGEMVLSRNQLLQAVSSRDARAVELSAQKINLVTSELQEAIMLTRMQPIGNILSKFPRVVRDLSGQLGKEIDLVLEGKEVELDKTLIEGLSDPLTHLVRNSIDHGIELPDERIKTGKNRIGKIVLRAYHGAGQVNIEISDDGKGIDGKRVASSAISKGLVSAEQVRTMSEKEKINLIFLPGASTAEKVTDISGRGVGMDVVKTNLDKLGGVVDIESTPLQGTTIRIKLPLTLAIIPSLIVSVGQERYAIPQVNVEELLRIPASQVKNCIEKVGAAEVVRLRESLLPLLHLTQVLDLEGAYAPPEDGSAKPDRRSEAGTRYRSGGAVNIVVVSAGVFKYGLVIDKLHDSEEIVVKPLGRHLKQCSGYAGATIMGDGRVALILDVGSLARMASLTSLSGTDRALELARETAKIESADHQSLLLFRNAPDEQFAVPLDMVLRVEQVDAADVEIVGGKRTIQYRGSSLLVFAAGDVANVKPIPDVGELLVIVFSVAGREIGLLATKPIDAAEMAFKMDQHTLRQPGIVGSTIIGDMTTLIVDVYEMMETLNPEWFTAIKMSGPAEGEKPTVLLAEDSEFFRGLLKKFMEDGGCEVIGAEDGMVAWELLQKHGDKIALVVTDIEMPNLDGYGLTKRIKGDSRFRHLKVIAVTSLAGDENIAMGNEAGIDDYQIKLDKEKLMASMQSFLPTY